MILLKLARTSNEIRCYILHENYNVLHQDIPLSLTSSSAPSEEYFRDCSICCLYSQCTILAGISFFPDNFWTFFFSQSYQTITIGHGIWIMIWNDRSQEIRRYKNVGKAFQFHLFGWLSIGTIIKINCTSLSMSRFFMLQDKLFCGVVRAGLVINYSLRGLTYWVWKVRVMQFVMICCKLKKIMIKGKLQSARNRDFVIRKVSKFRMNKERNDASWFIVSKKLWYKANALFMPFH